MTDSQPSSATSCEANTEITQLARESHHLDKTWPVFTEELHAFLANQDDPIGKRMYNLRYHAQLLQWSSKRIGDLLAILDGTPKKYIDKHPNVPT